MRRCLKAYQLPAVDIAGKVSNSLEQRRGRSISHDAADVNFVSGYLILHECFDNSRIPDGFTVHVRLVSKIQEIISKKLVICFDMQTTAGSFPLRVVVVAKVGGQ